jgi:hypothetical protein
VGTGQGEDRNLHQYSLLQETLLGNDIPALMNQNGHESGEKQLLRGSKMIEKEVSNGEEEGYDAKVIPMMAKKMKHSGRRDLYTKVA